MVGTEQFVVVAWDKDCGQESMEAVTVPMNRKDAWDRRAMVSRNDKGLSAIVLSVREATFLGLDCE
jgi:hypothetical protein